MTVYAKAGVPQARQDRYRYPKPMPAVVALIAGATCVVLAARYPLMPPVLTGGVIACWAAFYIWPRLWLLLLPPLLPLIGLAPWTGWITFEELDILVLAVAAGGYAQMAWPSPGRSASSAKRPHGQRGSGLVWLVLWLFALSHAAAMFRGFADAGGFKFGWFQGYHELNFSSNYRSTALYWEMHLGAPRWTGFGHGGRLNVSAQR